MIHDIIENMYVEQMYTSQIFPVRSLVDKGISMIVGKQSIRGKESCSRSEILLLGWKGTSYLVYTINKKNDLR